MAGGTSDGAIRTSGRFVSAMGEGSGGRGTVIDIPACRFPALRPGLALRKAATVMPQALAMELSVSP